MPLLELSPTSRVKLKVWHKQRWHFGLLDTTPTKAGQGENIE
jgi:hypothetical protein